MAGWPSTPWGEGILEDPLMVIPSLNDNVSMNKGLYTFGPSVATTLGCSPPSPNALLRPHCKGLMELFDQLSRDNVALQAKVGLLEEEKKAMEA
ncbi:hypothetical protein BHE74_00021888 [Ensete ventricosum]|nr:hypothetical protein BHE74_00021888 [Ensete ventricosum]RZS02601.1 hypothetical protein BHM03_00032665 [Ensete ventricosum]